MSEPTTEPTAEPTTQPEPTSQATSYENFGQVIDQFASDDIKQAGTWEKFRGSDVPTALKTIADMDSYIGKKGDIPQEGASPEDYAAFAGKLGFEARGEDHKYVEFSAEEFGEGAQTNNDIYNAGIADVMSRVREEFSKDPSMASIERALAGWATDDAKGVQARDQENAQLLEQQLNEVAGRYGINSDQLKDSNKETLAKYGWDLNNLTAYEVLHVLGRETSGSNTMRDALTSTPAGKQARLSEIYADPDFMDKSSPNYQKLVDESIRLFDELGAQNS